MAAQSRSISRRRTVLVSPPRRRGYYRARSRPAGVRVPVAIIAGLMPGAMRFLAWVKIGDYNGGLQHLVAQYTGYHIWDGKWSTDEMGNGLYPLMMGVAVHYIANAVGINRWLDKSRVPIIRV